MGRACVVAVAAVSLFYAIASPDAVAQNAESSGKALRLIVGTDVGGSYDVTGRLMSRHLPRFLTGSPTIVVQNMPGAGGLVSTNYLYNIAPRDGTVFGVIIPQVLLSQLFGEENARFEAQKFNWLGNPLGSAVVSAVFHTSAAKTWQEARSTEILMGATGSSGPDAFAVRLANATLGTKLKLVLGYKGGNDMTLAMERGEINGRGSQTWAGWKATNPDWVSNHKILPLWQLAAKRDPELPQVPLLSEIVEGSEAKTMVRLYSAISSMGRPFVAPPTTPTETVDALRNAFSSAFTDKDFIADATRVGIELGAISGQELQAMTQEFSSLDATLRARMKSVLSQ